MNEEKEKAMKTLNEIEVEAEILVKRVKELKRKLEKIKTKEEIVELYNGCNIEEGFKHIYLF